MNLGVVLVHSTGGSSDKISTLESLLSISMSIDGVLNNMAFSLLPDKPVKFYQAVKDGVGKPTNFESVYSRSVFYKENKADKSIQDWAYKRAKSEGSDVVVYINDVSQFSQVKLSSDLQNIKGDTLIYG